MTNLKAPFPYFGGKSKVAKEVWKGLGNVDNYVEPFAGSLAVLLARPHKPKVETVNDKDQYLANFWRALKHEPEQVAKHADWPINEADLFSRHMWLASEGKERIEKMTVDPDYFDPKVAGWWVWGICSWIAGGWCNPGSGPWMVENGKVVKKRGKGLKRKLPSLGGSGQSVNRTSIDSLVAEMQALADRLRRGRVCCGDWKRVVTRGALSHGKTIGIFLDPPYSGDVRDKSLYSTDDYNVAKEVQEWCIDTPMRTIPQPGCGT